ncbi:unnamed protein product [Sphagnum balticum]
MDHQPLKVLMESNYPTRKLVRWVFILHEHDFDRIHRVGKLNRDVDGLICNTSSNKEDTSKIHWHVIEFESDTMMACFYITCTLYEHG